MDDWQSEAACKNTDWHIFFPGGGQSGGNVSYKAAREVCRDCEVTDDCLSFALSFEAVGHRQGMFGGLTPKERDRLGVKARWCHTCGERFEDRSLRDTRYCSDECRRVAHNAASTRSHQRARVA